MFIALMMRHYYGRDKLPTVLKEQTVFCLTVVAGFVPTLPSSRYVNIADGVAILFCQRFRVCTHLVVTWFTRRECRSRRAGLLGSVCFKTKLQTFSSDHALLYLELHKVWVTLELYTPVGVCVRQERPNEFVLSIFVRALFLKTGLWTFVCVCYFNSLHK